MKIGVSANPNLRSARARWPSVPIITVKLKSGRSDEQKAAFDVAVRIAAVRDLGATESVVVVDYVEE